MPADFRLYYRIDIVLAAARLPAPLQLHVGTEGRVHAVLAKLSSTFDRPADAQASLNTLLLTHRRNGFGNAVSS